MRCPTCNHSITRVYDSRINTTNPKHHAILKKAGKVWDWWEPQLYRVRKRKCVACAFSFHSIEIDILDLEQALKDIRGVSDARLKTLQDLEQDNLELRQLLARCQPSDSKR